MKKHQARQFKSLTLLLLVSIALGLINFCLITIPSPAAAQAIASAPTHNDNVGGCAAAAQKTLPAPAPRQAAPISSCCYGQDSSANGLVISFNHAPQFDYFILAAAPIRLSLSENNLNCHFFSINSSPPALAELSSIVLRV